jgi:Ser/Thr protein kinase RdoA (MazF antagonist)
MEVDGAVMRELAERALRAWELRASRIELVSVSENVVFRVDTAEGETYALRLHRPGYHTLAELESEQMWTAALNDAGIGAPRGRRTPAGGYYATVAAASGDLVRHVGLVPWFDGVRLDEQIAAAGDEAARRSYFERLGQLMARMHDQAVAWQPPPGFCRHALDADGFTGAAPFWGRFWEIPQASAEQRRILVAARERVHALLSAYGTDRDTYSMIHADLRSANVLARGDEVYVIDFDDAGFGWHQYDMAVALFDHSITPEFASLRDALVAGYRAQRRISDEDLSMLPLFLLVRALASLGWLDDRPEVDLYALLPALLAHSCAQAQELLGV